MDNKKKEKSEGEKLAEKLLPDKKNGGLRPSEKNSKRQTSSARAIKAF